MQVNKISQNTTFGTKCYIGEMGAELSLKKYNKNLSKGILEAFNKLSKNDNTDIFSLSMGMPKDMNSNVINFSYFNKEGNYQSSISILASKLAKNSKSKISKLIQGYYNQLKESKEKAKNTSYFITKNNSQISNSHETLIKRLCNKYGSDDSSLFSA